MSIIQINCYHSTSYENALNIIREMHFNPSQDNGKLRLGVGTYFFVPGNDQTYAIACARELERYRVSKGRHEKKYAVLSCQIECDESCYLDLCDPDNMGVYHGMRYQLIRKQHEETPGYEFESPEAIDAYVLGVIRDLYQIHVVKCQEYFGMLKQEEEIRCKRHQKTLIPNVIMACVDSRAVQISNIKLIEEGEFQDEVTNCV